MMRLLVVGNSSVGKTCLLRRFSDGSYSDNFIPTVGIDFAVKKIKIDNKIIKVQIFDTAGQERFKSIISSYFRSADGYNYCLKLNLGILIVFDLTDKQSFEDIEEYWLRDIMLNSQENVKLIIVGNKMDMNKRQVTAEMGKKFAADLDLVYIETSAKTEQNVKEAFEAIVKDIYFRKKLEEQTTP